MTREEVKILLPVLQAFADGKTIQCKTRGSWEDIAFPLVGDLNDNPQNYRIKPSPTYRPFANAEECWNEMLKHQPFGWIKDDEIRYSITSVDDSAVNVIDICCDTHRLYFDRKQQWEDYTFADGQPFGVKVEED